ncbi:MAG: SAM-dependent chlorinase/fluorinase [Bacteroidota bacterium]
MTLVTLITDFGTSDYYVALLKGEILTRTGDCRFVDVTHDISPYDIMEGAFYLRSVYRHFPKGTIHVVGVHTFYAEQNELLVFEHEGHFFIGPNNGLFSLVHDQLDSKHMVAVPMANQVDLYLAASRIISRVSTQAPLDDIAHRVQRYEQKIALKPVINSHHIRATIIHVDRFGNVVANIDRATFQTICGERIYAIYFKSADPITRLSSSYSDVTVGDVCAFFNDVDLLEIGINMGNAHQLLNLNKNEMIQIDFHDIPD